MGDRSLMTLLKELWDLKLICRSINISSLLSCDTIFGGSPETLVVAAWLGALEFIELTKRLVAQVQKLPRVRHHFAIAQGKIHAPNINPAAANLKDDCVFA